MATVQTIKYALIVLAGVAGVVVSEMLVLI
jgi:hypothetical protein